MHHGSKCCGRIEASHHKSSLATDRLSQGTARAPEGRARVGTGKNPVQPEQQHCAPSLHLRRKSRQHVIGIEPARRRFFLFQFKKGKTPLITGKYWGLAQRPRNQSVSGSNPQAHAQATHDQQLACACSTHLAMHCSECSVGTSGQGTAAALPLPRPRCTLRQLHTSWEQCCGHREASQHKSSLATLRRKQGTSRAPEGGARVGTGKNPVQSEQQHCAPSLHLRSKSRQHLIGIESALGPCTSYS